jgi:hypothetical protein
MSTIQAYRRIVGQDLATDEQLIKKNINDANIHDSSGKFLLITPEHLILISNGVAKRYSLSGTDDYQLRSDECLDDFDVSNVLLFYIVTKISKESMNDQYGYTPEVTIVDNTLLVESTKTPRQGGSSSKSKSTSTRKNSNSPRTESQTPSSSSE